MSAAFELTAGRGDAVKSRIRMKAGRGLELSPGARPLISKAEANIVYCDKISSTDLRKVYGEDAFVEIDYVLGSRLLDELFEGERFHYIVSSHVLEHIPDFIQFFISARNILRPGGSIVKLVPDRRFTFDVLRRDSTIEDLEAAHGMRLRHPSRRMVEDFYFNTDMQATAEGLWTGTYTPQRSYSSDEARRLIDGVDAGSADLHCWTFTPVSFRTLIDHVIAHYVPSLRVIEISETPKGGNEFLVQLEAGENE
jgi:2-polyprenyl-3-methyl-5-hydroxy-6-metoxy-1,4-benzoquinol methylase